MSNRSVGVSVLLNDASRDDIADMRNIPIFNPKAKCAKLSDVAYVAQRLRHAPKDSALGYNAFKPSQRILLVVTEPCCLAYP